MSLNVAFSQIKHLEPEAVYLEDAVIDSVSIDTRSLNPGDTYVAICGERFDGHQFIDAAVESGASSLVVSQDVSQERPTLKVKDTVTALGYIAHLYRKSLKAPVIGITGSNGKTTVKGMLASIGKSYGNVTATSANQNNQIGVPLTLFSAHRDDDLLVVEMGTSEKGEIAALTCIVAPDISVLTIIAESHLEGLGSRDDVFREKSDIIRCMGEHGIAVINNDDDYAQRLAALCGNRQLVTYGIDNQASVRGSYELQEGKTRVTAVTTQGELQYYLAVPGRHNVLNSLAAVAAAQAAGVPEQAIVEGLQAFTGTPGRIAEERLPSGVCLLDDSYNANPASTRAALDVLAGYPGRKIFAFGGMAELGVQSEVMHRAVGEHAVRSGVGAVYGLQDAASVFDAFEGDSKVYQSVDSLSQDLVAALQPDDVVLVKGSRRYAMDKVASAIREAG